MAQWEIRPSEKVSQGKKSLFYFWFLTMNQAVSFIPVGPAMLSDDELF